MSMDQNVWNHLVSALCDRQATSDIVTALNKIADSAATAAELAVLAGVTPGTVAASKALVTSAGSALDALTITTATTSALVNAGTETDTPGASTAALGTNSGNAAVLPAATSKVYPTTAADDTVGVRIHANDKVTGRMLFIGNGVSNKILKVYAPTGGVINGAAADAAFSSASGKGVIIICLSGAGNTWLAW